MKARDAIPGMEAWDKVANRPVVIVGPGWVRTNIVEGGFARGRQGSVAVAAEVNGEWVPYVISCYYLSWRRRSTR